ncbi:MAG: Basic proline-rich protein precursor [Labilithrix sp.]|nr:Basic proline-rich protein precursor [Labilithrix sp.]
MLLIGDRVVLRANAPPEAEYILFEIGDIELRSSEPGRVREHGYQTTVERARARLAQAGATAGLARECGLTMQPVLSAAYARGPSARQVSRYLSPLELFQAEHYDGATHSYRGVFIDLPTLVADLNMPTASVALQALYLAMLLEGENDETTVFLSTDAWTKLRKPGERTHRRPNTAAMRDIRTLLGELASLDPRPTVREQLPRADVIAFIRTRAESAPDEDAQALYASLERSIAVRDSPDKGPLADPELWAIEMRLDTGDYDGILESVEGVERTRGRTPGTTYLRARASLALRLEPPKLVAERVSALALSMTSFQELCLLAAEAWLEAGDPRRAMPYARDLVDAPGVDEGLLLRAKRLLARAVGAAPEKHKTFADSIPAAAMPPSQRPGALKSQRTSAPPVSVPDPNVPRSFPPQRSRVPTEREELRPPTEPPPPPPVTNKRGDAATERDPERASAMAASSQASRRPPLSPPPPPPSARPPRAAPRGPSLPPPVPPTSAKPPPLPRRKPQSAEVVPSAPPPPLELDLPPPADFAASFTLDLPGPESLVPKVEAAAAGPSAPAAEHVEEVRHSQRPRRRSMGVVQMESRAPPGFDPRAEPDGVDSTPIVTTSRTASGRTVSASKETLKGKDLEEARRNARMSSIPPPPAIPRGEDDRGRPTPMRPGPMPARSGKPSPMRPPMPTPVLDADLPPSSTEAVARTLEREKNIRRNSSSSNPTPSSAVELAMRGASLPPYRLENPPPMLAKAPLLPKLGGASDELAEHLPLPAGLGSEPRSLDTLPKSVLEARVAFTLLARELGLDYRLKRGIELRADVSGIEAMQSVLLESFPEHAIRSPEDAYELRRHGALLSEILARRLDAEWMDISPNELGYWAMIVPADTRVWPFGRVARLVEMGHKERDLVSYFFELQGRARAR